MKFLSLPYQGSKLKIAESIINTLPKAEHLFDVFAGGCAVSGAALVSGKWRHVHISDTNDSVLLFRDILEGNIPDGSEWISREEFYERRDTDPYIRIFWSFANNQRDYIYSRQIEPYKKAVHEMIYAETPNERRLKFKTVCKLMAQIGGGADQEKSSISSKNKELTTNQLSPPIGNTICKTNGLIKNLYREQHIESTYRVYPPQRNGNQPIGNVGTIREEHGFLESAQRQQQMQGGSGSQALF